jgi:hypothetical protein
MHYMERIRLVVADMGRVLFVCHVRLVVHTCRCAKYFVSLGVKKENLLAVDVKVSRPESCKLDAMA